MTDDDSIMNEEQAGDAVARYLEEHPELIQEIVPAHDLWPAIENRISARVIPLTPPSSAARPGVRRAPGAMRWVPMLIAASALVASSAGITYMLTRRGAAPSASGAVASTAAQGNANRSVSGTGNVNVAGSASETGATAGALPGSSPDNASQSVHSASGAAERDVRAPVTRAAAQDGARTGTTHAQLAVRSDNDSGDPARTTYDMEIASLHTLLDARRSRLNPETMAVIEKNLHVIDEAIRQSREALAKDPNSKLLNNQLDRTLAQKTGLLRAAVLLPAA